MLSLLPCGVALRYRREYILVNVIRMILVQVIDTVLQFSTFGAAINRVREQVDVGVQ